jgi:hypothetical protein
VYTAKNGIYPESLSLAQVVQDLAHVGKLSGLHCRNAVFQVLCNLREVFGLRIAPRPRVEPLSANPVADNMSGASGPAGTAPQGANKMRKPTSCINEGEHQARLRVWMKNRDPEFVPSTFNCFVPMIDWDRRWRKFENGEEPICVCEDAAREMGMA